MLNNAVAVFAAPAPPVSNSYESIASFTLGSPSTITFSSIPAGYKHLQIRGISNLTTWLQFRINGTSSTSYTYHYLRGDGSTAAAGSGANADAITALGSGATYPTAFIMDILDYTNTNKYKTIRTLAGSDQNGSGGVGLYSNLYFANTNAITSISLYSYSASNLPTGTSIALYGIKG